MNGCVWVTRGHCAPVVEPGIGPRCSIPLVQSCLHTSFSETSSGKFSSPSLGFIFRAPRNSFPLLPAVKPVRNGWMHTTTPWPTSTPFPPACVSLWDQEPRFLGDGGVRWFCREASRILRPWLMAVLCFPELADLHGDGEYKVSISPQR